ncbi:hypothetical protein WA158_001907 [Blastocystis sp. Blastoise]
MDGKADPLWFKFASAAAAACTAEFFTIPFDTAKVRLQIQGEGVGAGAKDGMFKSLVKLSKEEGVAKLWKGLSPALQRQLINATLRIGLYQPIRDFYCGKDYKGEPPMLKKIAAGLTSGAIGITCACPTDLVKVRMQGGNSVYKNTREAYVDIVRKDGVLGLWKGYIPNLVRNSIVCCCELAGYDEAKELLLSTKYFKDNLTTHICSAAIAALLAVVFGSPVDVVKTRVMNARGQDGYGAFYKGFWPNYIRLGSWNILMFVVLEQIKHQYHKLH